MKLQEITTETPKQPAATIHHPLPARRWFGLAVCLLLNVVFAALFVSGFPDVPFGDRLQVIGSIIQGPFGIEPPYFFPLLGPASLVWPAWTSITLLIAHPIHPRWWTLILTCAGGVLWYLMGWYNVASGA